MKAVSVQQPWASLIAHGIKDIENRTWRTHFRGKVYIHASGKKVIDCLRVLNEEQYLIAQKYFLKQGLNKFSDLPLSAIIGEVEIVDCVINHPSIWAEKTPEKPIRNNYVYQNQSGIDQIDMFSFNHDLQVWKKSVIYNWVLANPVLYEKPILNVKGKLSFWEPDDCLQECIACGEHLKLDDTVCDDGGEYYHQECYDEMLPTLLKDAEENPID